MVVLTTTTLWASHLNTTATNNNNNTCPAPPRPPQIPDSQKDTGSNHAISAMKYQIIQEFLELGWDVLLR